MTHNTRKNFEMPPVIGKIIFICKRYSFKKSCGHHQSHVQYESTLALRVTSLTELSIFHVISRP